LDLQVFKSFLENQKNLGFSD